MNKATWKDNAMNDDDAQNGGAAACVVMVMTWLAGFICGASVMIAAIINMGLPAR